MRHWPKLVSDPNYHKTGLGGSKGGSSDGGRAEREGRSVQLAPKKPAGALHRTHCRGQGQQPHHTPHTPLPRAS